MPGISGLDVLNQVAELKLDMLTIMITAYASIETAVTATKRGAWEFLAKPFTPDELRNTLQKTAARVLLARRARALADEKRQVRFEFVRVLGHELKAPLAAVTSSLDILSTRALGPEIAAYDGVLERGLAGLGGIHDEGDLDAQLGQRDVALPQRARHREPHAGFVVHHEYAKRFHGRLPGGARPNERQPFRGIVTVNVLPVGPCSGSERDTT